MTTESVRFNFREFRAWRKQMLPDHREAVEKVMQQWEESWARWGWVRRGRLHRGFPLPLSDLCRLMEGGPVTDRLETLIEKVFQDTELIESNATEPLTQRTIEAGVGKIAVPESIGRQIVELTLQAGPEVAHFLPDPLLVDWIQRADSQTLSKLVGQAQGRQQKRIVRAIRARTRSYDEREVQDTPQPRQP